MERLEELKIDRCEMTATVHDYASDYNPDYSHASEMLAYTEQEIASMEGVASMEDIEAELDIRGRIARGEADEVIITTGSCERELKMSDDPDGSTEEIVNQILAQESVVRDVLPNARHESRDPNQHYKPRSEEYEKNINGGFILDNTGRKIPSFYGSGINGRDLKDRTPDPTRMAAGWLLARDIQEHYSQKTGKRLISTHEALLLPFERSSLRHIDGKKCLVSAVAPWIGDRTRGEGSPQVEILADVINPLGVKIGANATRGDIKRLYETLNPSQIDGKVMFILRLGIKNLGKLDELLPAIRDFAPKSLIVSDPMHGNTMIAKNGYKTRELPDLYTEISTIHSACKKRGLRLNGLHLEANGLDTVEECVETISASPKNKASVDPQLNNSQLRKVVEHFARLMS